VRERGFKIEKREGRLFCSFCAEPGKWVELELWVKNLYKSPRYAAVLEGLLNGTLKIGQAQILIDPHNHVSVRVLYEVEVQDAEGAAVAEIVASKEAGIVLQIGEHAISFEFDLEELARCKRDIDAQRVRSWRLLRGRRLRRRWPKLYRSGMLARQSKAWINKQRTFCQQFAAEIAKQAAAKQVGEIAVPSAEKFAEAIGSLIDFGMLSQSISNAAEGRGMKIAQITTEREQKRELRKKELEEKRKAKKNLPAAEGLQSGMQG
jgi:hypothetical protein